MGACFQKVELMNAIYVHMCLSGMPANFTAHFTDLITEDYDSFKYPISHQ